MTTATTPRKGTLAISYQLAASERFKNISDPDKIIANRNALKITSVRFCGQPFDISHHVRLYGEPKSIYGRSGL